MKAEFRNSDLDSVWLLLVKTILSSAIICRHTLLSHTVSQLLMKLFSSSNDSDTLVLTDPQLRQTIRRCCKLYLFITNIINCWPAQELDLANLLLITFCLVETLIKKINMEKPQHPNYAQFVELKFEKLLMIHSQNLKPLFMQINETVKNVKRFYYRLMPGAIIPLCHSIINRFCWDWNLESGLELLLCRVSLFK